MWGTSIPAHDLIDQVRARGVGVPAPQIGEWGLVGVSWTEIDAAQVAEVGNDADQVREVSVFEVDIEAGDAPRFRWWRFGVTRV